MASSKSVIIMKKYLTIFIIWLVLACVSAMVPFFLLDTFKYYRLSTVGILTQGRVIAKEPDNHQFIRYSYRDSNQTYTGIGSAGYGNPSFKDINVGQLVRVFYDPEDPRKSCLGDPTPRVQQTLFGIGFVAVLFPSFSIIALYYKGFLRKE
jgi:hypothetical protein